MFARWNEQYQLLMVRTRFLSQASAFWFALLSVLEFGRLCSALYSSYSIIGTELFVQAIVMGLFLISFFISFGLRFIILFKRSINRYLVIQAIWCVCAALLTVYVWRFDHGFWFRDASSFAIYDISRLDPFIVQGPIYIVFSVIRLLITAAIALYKAK